MSRATTAARTARRAVALALIGVLLTASAVSAAPVVARAVAWTVDDNAKTITATVRLRLGSACTRGQMVRAVAQGPAAAARCKVGPEVAQAIRDNVDAVWNQGLTYLCYRFKVVMDIETSSDLAGAVDGSAATPPDRHFIAIDQSPAHIRSFVSAGRAAGGTWDGVSPGDAMVPFNGSDGPSTWAYPPTWEDSLYAHEVGHVIGLSDQYDVVNGADGQPHGVPKEGAPDDVMANVTKTSVDATTLDRLLGRAGIDPLELKCDHVIDQATPGGRITGQKCNGYGGDWVIDATANSGGATVTQKWTVKIPEGAYEGTFTYADHGVTIVSGTHAESWGTSDGNASIELDLDGSVKMHLDELHHSGHGWATAGGRRIEMPEAPEPLVKLDFTWKPVACAAGG